MCGWVTRACSGRGQRVGGEGDFVCRKMKVSSTCGIIWNTTFSDLPPKVQSRTEYDKKNKQMQQQQQKGSQKRQNKGAPGRSKLEQHMTQICTRGDPEPHQGSRLRSESARPRNQKSSLPGVPLGTRVPGESIHGFQFPLIRLHICLRAILH